MTEWIEKNINPPGIHTAARRALFQAIGEIGGKVKTDALKAFNARFPYLADSVKLEEHGNALAPVLSNPLIHDNGASVKGKGVHFALRRLIVHLSRYYRKNKTNGVYFCALDTPGLCIKVTENLAANDPSKIIGVAPELPPGHEWYIEVRTYFSGKTGRLLKEMRTIRSTFTVKQV